MEKVIAYLILFLLREENKSLARHVVYGLPKENIDRKTLYIVPSGFFDSKDYMTVASLPKLPLTDCEGVPVLYGSSKIEIRDNYVVLEADILASTFFMISRYEEYVRRDVRDEHGRFIGHESLAYRAGFLDRPIVEDYGELLRSSLRKLGLPVKNPPKGFGHIYMTHDIDIPWSAKNTTLENGKQLLKDIFSVTIGRKPKEHLQSLRTLLHLQKDPVDTFDWLVDQDSAVKKCYGERFTALYFLMTCPQGKNDMGYICKEERTRTLLDKLIKGNASVGLHVSYRAGANPDYIQEEQAVYKQFMGETAKLSRHHYLMCREPEDMQALIKNGVTDDFSLCFADGGGYRLGTCRPVYWIDPVAKKVTSLVLHPLLATEGKLCGKQYMNMQPEDAVAWFRRQFERIYQENGEVTVLFHNSSFTKFAPYPYEDIYKGMQAILKEKNFYDENSNL